MVATEKVVLSAKSDGSDFILAKVIVESEPSVLKDTLHIGPAVVCVCDGLSDKSALAIAKALLLHPLSHFLHERSSFLPSHSFPGLEAQFLPVGGNGACWDSIRND